MQITFTGRGVEVTDQIRATAEHKLAHLEKMEPRISVVALELINEHHPRVDGNKRVEAALETPRKTFRARAVAPDIPSALDMVRQKLERQLRDHHGRRRFLRRRGVGSAESASSPGASGAEGATE
jgi:ribosomal subunit interface protein